MEHATKSTSDPQRVLPARGGAPHRTATLVDNRTRAVAQRELAAAINASARVLTGQAFGDTLRNGRRMVVQRSLVEAMQQSPWLAQRRLNVALPGRSAIVAQRERTGAVSGEPGHSENEPRAETRLAAGGPRAVVQLGRRGSKSK